jgi:predicted dehydrogenase
VKLKALLIGCGNVGAGYDFNKPEIVWSHAKAYSLNDTIELTVTDIDAARANKVAAIYNVKVLHKPAKEEFKDFQLISIATPTTTHFEYLKNILSYSPAVIICEKPVVGFLKQADEILNIYKSAGSRVLVNYMRRFQPGYKMIKEKLKNEFDQVSLREIIIKYSRGFLNNASHAVDLLEFLYGEPFEFKNFYIQKSEFDSFEYDPTLTGSCFYLDQPVNFAGICDVRYPIFEIEIFYTDSKIVICHSGNEIRYYSKNNNVLKENLEKRQTNMLDTYMVHVISEAVDLFHKRKIEDNFIPALMINKRMLEIIEPLKKPNVTISN